jgi:chaperone protein EcpD
MDIQSTSGHARHGRRGIARARIATATLAIATAALGTVAHAGVVIQGTRVVYPVDEREVTVRMTNQRAHPVLIEAWIDCPVETPTCTVPFALTPPLFRLDPGKGQTLRIFQAPGPVPTDRESLYWLNVRDIAPKAAASDDNQLSIAFRSRLKFFHRPANLRMQAKDAPQALRWHADGARVRVENPTPYFVSITAIEVRDGEPRLLNGVMVAPFADCVVPMPEGVALRPGQPFHFTIVNDLGGTVRVAGTPAKAP